MTNSNYISPIKRELKILYITNGEYIYPPNSITHFGLSHWHIDVYRERTIRKFVMVCSHISKWKCIPYWFVNLPRNHAFGINEFEFIFTEEITNND